MNRTPILNRALALLLVALTIGACAGPATTTTAPPTDVPVQPTTAATQAEQPSEVLIGAVYPLTGDGATSGEAYKVGIEMAMEVINNAHPELEGIPLAATAGLPNLGGAPCNVFFADSETRPEKGAAEVERLINEENVAAILGLAFSSATAAAQPIAERYGIPLMSAGSTSPPLTEQGYQWFFRVGPHDGMSTEAMFDFLDDLKAEKGAEINTVAILHEDTEVGVGSAEVQVAMAQELGYEVVEQIQYRRDSPSLNTEIQRLKAANPDVLLPTSYVGDAILIVNAMKELDYNPPVVLWSGGSVALPFWLESVGDDGQYQMTRSRWSSDLADTVPAIEQLRPMYEQMSGQDIAGGDLYFMGFVNGLVMCDAINRAGSTDPEAIRQALLATDIPAGQLPAPWGVQFDPATGQNTRAYMKIDQLFERTWYTVWPFDVATHDVVYPIPAWADR
jgi:branched-chain amino acid transport system substrate-binding protein